MRLVLEEETRFPFATRRFVPEVSLELAAHDKMFTGDHHHYLSCGASALNTILAAQMLGCLDPPATILDFGAGAGRVTRWLRAAFPQAAIAACDLRAQDMAFCASAFAATTWVSSVDIPSLAAPGTYDLIWLGSVATHLPARKTAQLLDKMLSWTNAGGLVVMSLHGRFALARQNSGRFAYIDDERWQAIAAAYGTDGYGYADYPGQSDYGISVSKLSWIAKLVEARSDTRLVLLAETVWHAHHDVVAVQAVR